MAGLVSFDDARAHLLAAAEPLAGVEHLPLDQAVGRILAASVRSDLDVPAADNSQMDGYALRLADLDGRDLAASWRVSQRIAAGQVGTTLEAGSVARIFTGAPMPPGSDAVIMQEATELRGDEVILKSRPKPGDWVRRRAEDIAQGAEILPAGIRLSAQAVGLAASVGLPTLAVRQPLRVACLFTGDELLDPGEPMRAGALYNSNRPMLVGLIRQLGCAVTDLGRVPDRLDATREVLARAAADHDLVVSCGGMSVGEEDHVRPAVEAEGSLDLWAIAMKPGKPLAHGRIRRAEGAPAHFLGLPGNPVSALITFVLLGRPLLARLQGESLATPGPLRVRADFDWPKPDPRREFLRVRLNGEGGLERFPSQGSAVLTSTVWADGLVDNPAGQVITRGDLVAYLPWAALLG